MTATHQLKIAVMSVAFVGRSLLFTSLSTSSSKPVDLGGGDDTFMDLIAVSLSNALLGMDANDPPKTLATMQLIGSIFSNVRAWISKLLNKVAYIPSQEKKKKLINLPCNGSWLYWMIKLMICHLCR